MNPRFELRMLVRPLVLLLTLAGVFTAGYFTCLKTRHITPPAETARMLQPAGDAPADVHAGVQTTLNTLALAYLRHDSSQIDMLMQAAFAPEADVIVLGAEGLPYQWVRGQTEMRAFLERNWQSGELLRFDPSKTLVWSSGNVAWMATLGDVESKGGNRQIRLTAVLEKRNEHWVFRQMQFQWNDGAATADDLIKPETYFSLLRRALQNTAQ